MGKLNLTIANRNVIISLPDWLIDYESAKQGVEFKSKEEMMAVAVEISALNVKHNSGGPFGCAIFARNRKTQVSTLFSVGANRVVPLSNSTLHGEMTAIQYAEKKLKHFSLKTGDDAEVEYVMCTSCEPCAQCLGGTLWAGPSEMICAGTKEDAERIGFDEGPVFPESYKHLERAGVQVTKEVLRKEAALILDEYGKVGEIYNS